MAEKRLNFNDTLVSDDLQNQFLTFVIDSEDYGLVVENIKEIITVCDITKVPHTEEYLKGVINLRGEIIPVIDVRGKFFLPPKEYDKETCIIVIEYSDYSLGLVVDRVKEVIFINNNNLNAPPKENYDYKNEFIKYIGHFNDEIKLILDIDKLIGN
ncbi:MAG: chemotaxis protein CheW [Lachnospirales bacterium]